mgnify:CR=1 FL=1|jgi:hypothetical protein|tara:strand:+ start:591 stop:1220 length:630 start_codon:yes stop_codon:yes gene_type:complete
MSYIGANAQGLIANVDGGTIENATLDSTVTFPAGHILQVQQSVKTDTDSTRSGIGSSGSGFQSISGTDQNGSGSIFCCKITPKFSNSKILVSACINVGGDNASYTYLALFRDSSSVFIGDVSTSRKNVTAMTFSYGSNEGVIDMIPIEFLDSPTIPATPTEIVYEVKFVCAMAGNNLSTATINSSFRDSASGFFDARTASSITLMEVSS